MLWSPPSYRYSSLRVDVSCNVAACTISKFHGGNTTPTERAFFPRENLLKTQTVRIRNGEVVDPL
jgi:hypothetical protein